MTSSLSNLMRRALCAATLVAMPALVSAADLAALQQAGRHEEFLAEAQKAAEKNDVEALFLLGKAYHLGLGVKADTHRARELYSQAIEVGNDARAYHNRGLLALDEGWRKEAIEDFGAALYAGLKVPTLFNLGRVYEPVSSEGAQWGDWLSADMSARYYAQSFALRAGLADLRGAMRSSVRAYMMLTGNPRAKDSPLLTEYRDRALHWCELAQSRGLPEGFHNRGAVALADDDQGEARRWYEKAAAMGFGQAMVMLGQMESRSGNTKEGDEWKEDEWLEKASQAGYLPATEELVRSIDSHFGYNDDLGTWISRLERLSGRHDAAFRRSHERHIADLRRRLLIQQELEANAARAGKKIPDQPVRIEACVGADARGEGVWIVGAHGTTGSVHRAIEWPLATGKLDAKGCVKLTKGQGKAIRAALQDGQTPLIHIGGETTYMSVTRETDGRGLLLKPDARLKTETPYEPDESAPTSPQIDPQTVAG